MATAPSPAGGWGLPRPVLLRSLGLSVVGMVPIVVAVLVAGPGAAAGAGLGLILGLSAAAVLPTGPAAVIVLLHLLVALAGILVAGSPVAGALVVALSGLASGPAYRAGFGRGLIILPMVAVFAASGAFASAPVAGELGLAAGAAWALLLARVAGPVPVLVPLPRSTAWIHAVALAATCGIGTFVALAVPLPHGYWIVVTLTATQFPVVSESVDAMRDRLAGTLLGALAGGVAGAVLPVPLQLVAVFATLILQVGYSLVGDGTRKVTMLTAMTVLLLAGATGASTLEMAAQRLAWTIAGAGLVGGAAFIVRRMTGARRWKPASAGTGVA